VIQKSNKVVKSFGEQVYDYLFEQLRQKSLVPGTYLDLDEIAAKLGISRTPLRDALLSLEREGYVEIIPRRGVLVKHLALEDVRDLYQVIGTLEATALLAAAPKLGPEDYRRLDEMTMEYQSLFDEGNYDACLLVNYRFHDYFLDRSGNNLLTRTVHNCKLRLYDWPRHSELLLEWEKQNVEEHRRILERIVAGDARGAADILQNVHWSFQKQELFIQPFYEGEVKQPAAATKP
jgi:DNA-binding GntR family transcriptional regulator